MPYINLLIKPASSLCNTPLCQKCGAYLSCNAKNRGALFAIYPLFESSGGRTRSEKLVTDTKGLWKISLRLVR